MVNSCNLVCCGYFVDEASVICENAPRPGDFTICLNCGAWLRFQPGDLPPRRFQAEDILELEAEQIGMMRRATQEIQTRGPLCA